MAFNKKKVKHIVFDSDGTLVDTMPSMIEAYAHMAEKELGIAPEHSKQQFKDTTGNHFLFQLRDLCEKHNIPKQIDEAFLNELRARFRERILMDETKAFPDVKPALEKLSKKYTLSVSSGALEPIVVKKLKLAGIDRYFSVILGHAENNAYSKGPQHVDELQKRHHLKEEDLENIVFIGDARKDIEIAKDAGMFSVARVGTFHEEKLKEFGADLVVNDLKEFVSWLERKD